VNVSTSEISEWQREGSAYNSINVQLPGAGQVGVHVLFIIVIVNCKLCFSYLAFYYLPHVWRITGDVCAVLGSQLTSVDGCEILGTIHILQGRGWGSSIKRNKSADLPI
jgi:hypothetical protein